MTDYKAVAKTLGVRYLFGRWGIRLLPTAPSGQRSYRLFSIVPLDGWIMDPKDVEHEMRERGFEL